MSSQDSGPTEELSKLVYRNAKTKLKSTGAVC
jgi:hypothetical protein